MNSIKYLIIDDDHVFSLWLKTNLADLFPNFEHISSRVDTLGGLLDIQRMEPDLIFLDQYIDGLSGFDVLDLMKQQPKTVMISSEDINENEISEYSNVIGFISKPVDLDKLKDLLEKNGLNS